MHKKKGLLLFVDFVLAMVLIGLDLLTKCLAVDGLKGRDAFPIIKGVLELDYLQNYGTAFGMFQNKRIFILLTGCVFMGIILFLLFRTPATRRFVPVHVCLVGIFAGGIGNMLDRFVLGYVRDFISFVLIHFPVFNVADCYIVVFVILMAVLVIFVYQEEELGFLGLSGKQKQDSKDSTEKQE